MLFRLILIVCLFHLITAAKNSSLQNRLDFTIAKYHQSRGAHSPLYNGGRHERYRFLEGHRWMTFETGHFENPGWYFEEGMSASADLLILTKRWRRFSKLVADPLSKFLNSTVTLLQPKFLNPLSMSSLYSQIRVVNGILLKAVYISE